MLEEQRVLNGTVCPRAQKLQIAGCDPVRRGHHLGTGHWGGRLRQSAYPPRDLIEGGSVLIVLGEHRRHGMLVQRVASLVQTQALHYEGLERMLLSQRRYEIAVRIDLARVVADPVEVRRTGSQVRFGDTHVHIEDKLAEILAACEPRKVGHALGIGTECRSPYSAQLAHAAEHGVFVLVVEPYCQLVHPVEERRARVTHVALSVDQTVGWIECHPLLDGIAADRANQTGLGIRISAHNFVTDQLPALLA